MQTTELTHKLIKSIKDERFDADKIHQYALYANVGTKDIQIGVVDTDDNRLLVLEDYVFPTVSSHNQLVSALDQLFESHAFLRAGFWRQIKFSFKNQNFVQVPLALFSEDALTDYLKFNTHINVDQEEFIPVFSKNAQAVTVFAVHRELKDWIQKTYPNNLPVIIHQSAVLIEGVLGFAKTRSDNPLYVYIDRFKLHILSVHQGKLIYYNQFAIKQFSDYVKYIMLVMKSLNMEQKTSQIILWGYIGKDTPHHKELYKYINNVEFGGRPSFLQFAYFFDELQDHHYFDLYNIHLCGE